MSEGPEPHPALRTKLCDLVGVRYPIVQTGMGWVAGPRLVAATAKGVPASTMTTQFRWCAGVAIAGLIVALVISFAGHTSAGFTPSTLNATDSEKNAMPNDMANRGCRTVAQMGCIASEAHACAFSTHVMRG